MGNWNDYLEDGVDVDTQDLQQRLALSQLENVKLREALSIATINNGEGGYLENEKEQFKILLSTPPDATALKEWMMGHLGEPMAWAVENVGGHMIFVFLDKQEADSYCYNDKPIPLYEVKD